MGAVEIKIISDEKVIVVGAFPRVKTMENGDFDTREKIRYDVAGYEHGAWGVALNLLYGR